MDTELHIISCCLIKPVVLNDLILAGVDVDWFKGDNHKCFQGMLDRLKNNQTIDIVWMQDYMGLKYVNTLLLKEVLIPQHEAMTALSILKKRYQRQELDNIIDTIKRQHTIENADPVEIIDNIIQRLSDLKNINLSLSDKSKIKESIIKELNRGIKISTGYSKLDFMIKGIQLSVLIIVGGYTSHGKSIFVLNIARNVAEKGHEVMIFSTEMNEEQLTRRLAMMYSGVNPSIATSISEEEKDMFTQSIDKAQELPIHILKTLSLSVIRANIQKSSAKLYIIDFIQMIKPDMPIDNDVRRLGYIVRQLEMMTKEYDCCIIATSQFSRPYDKTKLQAPSGHSFRGSGEIEECVDIAILMYYPFQSATEDQRQKIIDDGRQNIINLDIWKNRIHGLTGMVRVKFDKQSMTIKEEEE